MWKGINEVKKHVGLIPLATFWVAWKERNKRAFDAPNLIGLRIFGSSCRFFC